MNSVAAPRPTAFGKYVLVERLGRGGMAEVWKAKMSGPAGFSRTLVVKRILPHLVEDETFVQMFVAEARLSARLNHTNIVQVYELGDVNGEYFLAMEYVRGRDLVSVMRAQILRGPPDPGLAAYVMREVCRALAYAHSLVGDDGQALRLIHRDVSPSNVMISFDGAVKLLDFGIAKALADSSDNRTQTGTLKGKFGYMAPEQVEGRAIDHRADLFSAGVVLHEALTGRRLFKGSSDMQTIAMVRDAMIDQPSSLNPAVIPELDRVVLKALAKDPNDRYANCDDMAMDLDSVLHELKWGPERARTCLKDLFPDEPSQTMSKAPEMFEPVESQHTSAFARMQRSQRRKIYAGVGAAVVLVLGGLGIWKAQHKPVAPIAVVATPPTIVPASEAPPNEPRPVPLSADVKVRVHTNPSNADVTVEGETVSRGKTPLTMTLPRSGKSVSVTMSLRGYKPMTSVVTPDADTTLQLSLLAASSHSSRPEKSEKPDRSKSKSAAAERQPAGPNLKNGDVVDPFK